ncbi:MAG: exodeoxyribonuclease VII small subunit [Prevotellaceae bacterium]|nr:exodeoxyribonuclease VII small subunit [Prevotellaceae bacterium]
MGKEMTYEQAMRRLEELASQMERSEIGIDEMADRLRQAQELMKYCHEKLYEAEKNCNSLLNVEEKA